MAVSLAEAKAHLRITHNTDDAYVTSLIEAAQDYVVQVGVAIAPTMPTPVRHAILLLISHFYEHRDAATDRPPAAIAYGVNALLSPYRTQDI
ncbi:head-tail connector protein [Mesorhizobium sp. 1M-11]|uniref:head-tail connector protein n=1 Tax=Mesorhizobium sp. 1M-11 TaxID=1529006 RepID=UPI0006C76EA8|nr:head-tail connector protein [Mesorhizobium sp. 1M-11]